MPGGARAGTSLLGLLRDLFVPGHWLGESAQPRCQLPPGISCGRCPQRKQRSLKGESAAPGVTGLGGWRQRVRAQPQLCPGWPRHAGGLSVGNTLQETGSRLVRRRGDTESGRSRCSHSAAALSSTCILSAIQSWGKYLLGSFRVPRDVTLKETGGPGPHGAQRWAPSVPSASWEGRRATEVAVPETL